MARESGVECQLLDRGYCVKRRLQLGPDITGGVKKGYLQVLVGHLVVRVQVVDRRHKHLSRADLTQEIVNELCSPVKPSIALGSPLAC